MVDSITSPLPVVVGVDGSSSALDAVVFAAGEAQRRQATLRVVQALVWPMLDIPDSAGPGLPGLRVNAERQLAAAANVARRTAADIEVDTHLITGWPGPALARSSYGAALIVIGIHASGRAVTDLVGSTATELAATSHAPIVVVRRSDELAVTPAEDAPVIVGIDGSAASQVAARFAAEEAHLVGAPLHVVQVRPSPAEEVADRALVDQLRRIDPDREIEFRALDGHAASELVSAAKFARLVVVGTRGRSGMTGLILGSVSHALLEHAACPVAVMPRPLATEVTSSPRWDAWFLRRGPHHDHAGRGS